MVSTADNAAKVNLDDDLTDAIDEPSMEEILASIKKIIADDEQQQSDAEARQNFSHPDNPSNSNDASDIAASDDDGLTFEVLTTPAADSETPDEASDANSGDAVQDGMQAALEAELNAASSVVPPQAEAPAAVVAHPPVAEAAVPAVEPQAAAVPVAVHPAREESLAEKIARVRSEVTSSAAGLSTDERLAKYRVRGQLQAESSHVAAPAQAAASAPAASQGLGAAISQGPILPTSEAVAREMAQTMMQEKSDAILGLMAEILRPTIRKWLSENLPVMVEKLVREEIERVSRGKQAS